MDWPVSLRAGSVVAGVVALAALFVPACPIHIHSTAFLEAEERFEVRADEAGFVRGILARDGESVAPGQPLVRLEDPDLAARVGTVRLERERARAAMLRDEALGDAASAAQWRTAWERLGEEYEIVRRRHASLTLRSPGSGIVIAPRLGDRLGTRLRRGDLWCELARSDRLRAYVEVRETDLSDVFEGARVVALSSGYPTRRFVGRVVRVPRQGSPPPEKPRSIIDLPVAKEVFSVYQVEALLENPGHLLRPGMSVALRLEGPRRSLAGRAARAFVRVLRGKIWW